MASLLKDLPQRLVELPPITRGLVVGPLDGGLGAARRPYRGHHPMNVESKPALVEGDREYFRHALGHTDRRRQPQHRTFPCGKGSFGGDVAKCSDVDVAVRGIRIDPVDIRRYPHQSAVAMPDR